MSLLLKRATGVVQLDLPPISAQQRRGMQDRGTRYGAAVERPWSSPEERPRSSPEERPPSSCRCDLCMLPVSCMNLCPGEVSEPLSERRLARTTQEDRLPHLPPSSDGRPGCLPTHFQLRRCICWALACRLAIMQAWRHDCLGGSQAITQAWQHGSHPAWQALFGARGSSSSSSASRATYGKAGAPNLPSEVCSAWAMSCSCSQRCQQGPG